MSDRQVIFNIPAMLAVPRRFQRGVELPGLPGLARLLARSSRYTCAPGRHGLYHDAAERSLAELLAGESNPALCLADPVLLQPGSDDLVVLGPAMVAADDAELASIREAVNEHFAPDLALSLVDGQLLARSALFRDLHFTPTWRAQGHGAREALPSGAQAGKVHALLNEVQMLLHQHAVNRQREARGQAPISSLWFWNEQAARNVHRDFPGPQELLGESALLAALARELGSTQVRKPGSFEADLVDQGSLVIELDAAVVALDRDDIAAWQEALQDIDSRWLQPAAAALAAGRIDAVDLYAGDGQYYRARPSDRWKLWRRRRPTLLFGE
ncbi:MAG: hypothetical protein R3217_06070 [Gammaproteobacteria bacterium]|nr:hypothetical protein [Gammaproteobacteria bacterium]